jgi:hypothetical protein
MDHEHILALVEAVHGAHGDAIHGFAANAAFVDDESQFSTPNSLERATLAKKVVPYTQQSEPVLFCCGALGRDWHKADILKQAHDVRFWR